MWSRTTRGTVAAVDDLSWDAAASLDDRPAGAAVRDPDRFHAQYLYIWGERAAPLEVADRTAAWDERLNWLLSHIEVLDRHERRLVSRGEPLANVSQLSRGQRRRAATRG